MTDDDQVFELVALRYIRYPVSVVATKWYLEASWAGIGEIEMILIAALKVSVALMLKPTTFEYVLAALLVMANVKSPFDVM